MSLTRKLKNYMALPAKAWEALRQEGPRAFWSKARQYYRTRKALSRYSADPGAAGAAPLQEPAIPPPPEKPPEPGGGRGFRQVTVSDPYYRHKAAQCRFKPQKELISLIIPPYGPDYLNEVIAGALPQTYGHWEIVVIDDASKEGDGQVGKVETAITAGRAATTGSDGSSKSPGAIVNAGLTQGAETTKGSETTESAVTTESAGTAAGGFTEASACYDERIRRYSHPHRLSPVAVINEAVAKARGDYLCFVEGRHPLDKDLFLVLAGIMVEKPELEAIYAAQEPFAKGIYFHRRAALFSASSDRDAGQFLV